MRQRILMRPDAPRSEIIAVNGKPLGWFMPGLGYWITAENIRAVEEVLELGEADLVEPSGGSGLMAVNAVPAEVAGSVSVDGAKP